jgi:isopenicillin-N N-acyltransferase-like protein
VAGRADASGLVLGQTWDFHPDLAAARLLWTVEQADGSWWVTFTEAGVLAKIGMNSRGVALAINFLSSPADGGVDGVPVHVLARCVLEECGSMEDVEALLRATPRSASLCATVATRHDRRLAAFELSPDAVVRREPDVAGRLAHTNHFLDDVPETANGRNSVRRLEQLDAGLAAAAPVSALLSDAGDVDDPIFRFEDPSVPWLTRCATLATLAFDVEAGRMWIRDALDPSVELAEVELTA